MQRSTLPILAQLSRGNMPNGGKSGDPLSPVQTSDSEAYKERKRRTRVLAFRVWRRLKILVWKRRHMKRLENFRLLPRFSKELVAKVADFLPRRI